MKSFIQKYEPDVMGSLSGFDRLVFRGTLRRLSYSQGMDYCLAFWGVLLKDFAEYVLEVTARIKKASLAMAQRAGRPIQYLTSSQIRKEDLAREIAVRDNLADGLICVLTCVDPYVEPLRFTALKSLKGFRSSLISASVCTSIIISFIPA
ncbi:MAG: hypothetical protein FJ134_14330 [Deltaproteobacteria bacterium]|nr:hypothetical protein [Deltaproteobacteria bacterium]